MLSGMLLLCAGAHAAGFHFLKGEAIVGVDATGGVEAGVGASMVSDAARAWMTFGDAPVGVVKAWRIEARPEGPVIGWVPRDFRALYPAYPRPWLFRWTSARLGGDADLRQTAAGELTVNGLLNLPGFADVDPRHAYAGPSLAVGAHATAWRGAEATGSLTASAGLAAGITLRDTWYAQARGEGRVDLFGTHALDVGGSAITGLYFARAGLPVGIEVTGELHHGADRFDARPGTDWTLRGALYFKRTPQFQTPTEERIEQRIEARRASTETASR